MCNEWVCGRPGNINDGPLSRRVISFLFDQSYYFLIDYMCWVQESLCCWEGTNASKQCIGMAVRLYFCQLLNQFLGISRRNVVHAIVLVLNLDGHIAHQQTAHRKRGHRYISAHNFRRAVGLILEARERGRKVIHFLDTLVEGLDEHL